VIKVATRAFACVSHLAVAVLAARAAAAARTDRRGAGGRHARVRACGVHCADHGGCRFRMQSMVPFLFLTVVFKMEKNGRLLARKKKGENKCTSFTCTYL